MGYDPFCTKITHMPIDNQSELFYHVDANDKIKGYISRKAAHTNKKNIHRAVAVFVLNKKMQMLMQKRSRKKDMDPGKWSYAVGGHVTVGQTYMQCALREIEEELGIKTSIKLIAKVLIKMKKETEYTALFEAKISSNTSITIDQDEVAQTKWIPIDQLKTFIKTHSVADWTTLALKAARYLTYGKRQ